MLGDRSQKRINDKILLSMPITDRFLLLQHVVNDGRNPCLELLVVVQSFVHHLLVGLSRECVHLELFLLGHQISGGIKGERGRLVVVEVQLQLLGWFWQWRDAAVHGDLAELVHETELYVLAGVVALTKILKNEQIDNKMTNNTGKFPVLLFSLPCHAWSVHRKTLPRFPSDFFASDPPDSIPQCRP